MWTTVERNYLSTDISLCVQVLQDLLDILHDHANQIHAARLEIIVIWLIGKPL